MTDRAPIDAPIGRLLKRREVEHETGLSRSTIYDKMEKGTFPKPRRIGPRGVRWPSEAIERWKRTTEQT